MRFSVFCAAAVLLLVSHARAQTVPAATAPTPAPSPGRVLSDGSPGLGDTAAQEHFQRALLWYRAGKYRLAIEELDAALDRDPNGKDLVFNLALVQEKLGDLAGAIRSLQRFQTLETDPVELERTNQTIQRLQGARAELAMLTLEPRVIALPTALPPARQRGKLDAWVVSMGGLAAASFLTGVVFAVRTLALGPRGDAASQNTQRRAERAHSAALVADLALSASVLAGAGAVALYFGRYADAAPQHAALPLHLPPVSAAWLELRY